jgi:hypothetical protein
VLEDVEDGMPLLRGDAGKTVLVQPRAHRFVVGGADGLVRFCGP